MSKVAFCVVAWNNAAVLGQCLDSLLAQQRVDAAIYLMDNGSTDATRQLMAAYPQVHVTWSSENHGFARGNNLLIKQALSDPDVKYVALVNSDATLAPDWANRLVDFAEEHENVGCMQGLTLNYFNHDVVDSEHILVNGNLQGEQYGEGSQPQPGMQPRKVFGVNAAAGIYTRVMIEALPDQNHGYFDERFFMYYEDVDACFRSLVTGWDAWFVPAAQAFHMGATSAKKQTSSFITKMVARNLPAMVFKNAPGYVIAKSLPAAAKGMSWWLGHIRREQGRRAMLRTAASLLKGIARIPLYIGSRRRIQAARVMDAHYLLHIMRNRGILD